MTFRRGAPAPGRHHHPPEWYRRRWIDEKRESTYDGGCAATIRILNAIASGHPFSRQLATIAIEIMES